MKKFIFAANVIAIITLVPAVLFGYLHSNTQADTKQNTEMVKELKNGRNEGFTLRLVKSF